VVGSLETHDGGRRERGRREKKNKKEERKGERKTMESYGEMRKTDQRESFSSKIAPITYEFEDNLKNKYTHTHTHTHTHTKKKK
jgi:hypothetical protein